MQDELFGAPFAQPPESATSRSERRKAVAGVLSVTFPAELHALAKAMPQLLRFGVSTWSYPGWEGLVWDGTYDSSVLSRKGLHALSQHPLMRTVCVDRAFWRPLSIEQYAQYAAQVPEDFRFVIKCPNVVTDALVRNEEGKAQQNNPAFLQPSVAISQFVEPAVQGLGNKLGVLVFQLSPLSAAWLYGQQQLLLEKLRVLLSETTAYVQHAGAPHVIVALEVRDPELLTPELAQTLRQSSATYCLGLHGKMPPIEAQLPILRSLWPTPLVCRWNLNRLFGAYGYPDAQAKHQPFSEIRTPDLHTRERLARTIAGITGAGQAAFVTISNDAEGCAPRSITLLAQRIAAMDKNP